MVLEVMQRAAILCCVVANIQTVDMNQDEYICNVHYHTPRLQHLFPMCTTTPAKGMQPGNTWEVRSSICGIACGITRVMELLYHTRFQEDPGCPVAAHLRTHFQRSSAKQNEELAAGEKLSTEKKENIKVASWPRGNMFDH